MAGVECMTQRRAGQVSRVLSISMCLALPTNRYCHEPIRNASWIAASHREERALTMARSLLLGCIWWRWGNIAICCFCCNLCRITHTCPRAGLLTQPRGLETQQEGVHRKSPLLSLVRAPNVPYFSGDEPCVLCRQACIITRGKGGLLATRMLTPQGRTAASTIDVARAHTHIVVYQHTSTRRMDEEARCEWLAGDALSLCDGKVCRVQSPRRRHAQHEAGCSNGSSKAKVCVVVDVMS